MVFLGDVFVRLSRQNREPVLTFKRLLIDRAADATAAVDPALYMQLVRDFVSGAMVVAVDAPRRVVQIVAMIMTVECRGDFATAADVLKAGLKTVIPAVSYHHYADDQAWAEQVLAAIQALNANAHAGDQSLAQMQSAIVSLMALDNPLYGAQLFACYHGSGSGNGNAGMPYNVAVNGESVMVLGRDYAAQSVLLFKDIQKFGASPTFFWARIGGNLVTFFTHQSTEMYFCVRLQTAAALAAAAATVAKVDKSAEQRAAMRKSMRNVVKKGNGLGLGSS